MSLLTVVQVSDSNIALPYLRTRHPGGLPEPEVETTSNDWEMATRNHIVDIAVRLE